MLQDSVWPLDQRDHTEAQQSGVRKQDSHTKYQPCLSLTNREREVLRLVAEGHTDRKVAEVLVISHRTVNRHLSNIFAKLDVSSRAAAVASAIWQGFV